MRRVAQTRWSWLVLVALAGCAAPDPHEVESWVAVRPERAEWFDHEPVQVALELLDEPGEGDVPLRDVLERGYLRLWEPSGLGWRSTAAAVPDVPGVPAEGELVDPSGRARLEALAHRGEPLPAAVTALPWAGEWVVALEVEREADRRKNTVRTGIPGRVVASTRVRVREQTLDLPASAAPELRASLARWLVQIRENGRHLPDYLDVEPREEDGPIEEVIPPEPLARALAAAHDDVWLAAGRLFALRPTLARVAWAYRLRRHAALLLSWVRLDRSPLDELLVRAVSEVFPAPPRDDGGPAIAWRALPPGERTRALQALKARVAVGEREAR